MDTQTTANTFLLRMDRQKTNRAAARQFDRDTLISLNIAVDSYLRQFEEDRIKNAHPNSSLASLQDAQRAFSDVLNGHKG